MGTTDLETVRRLAVLARLALGEEELARFAPELERILAAFEVLARRAPSPSEPPPAAEGVGPRTREDEPQPSLARETLLAAASEREDGFFAVPKTVGGER